jgi:hypothetical protein
MLAGLLKCRLTEVRVSAHECAWIQTLVPTMPHSLVKVGGVHMWVQQASPHRHRSSTTLQTSRRDVVRSRRCRLKPTACNHGQWVTLQWLWRKEVLWGCDLSAVRLCEQALKRAGQLARQA